MIRTRYAALFDGGSLPTRIASEIPPSPEVSVLEARKKTGVTETQDSTPETSKSPAESVGVKSPKGRISSIGTSKNGTSSENLPTAVIPRTAAKTAQMQTVKKITHQGKKRLRR